MTGVLREHEAGARTADLAREHGVSAVYLLGPILQQGFPRGKRLTQLEDESAKLLPVRKRRARHRAMGVRTKRPHSALGYITSAAHAANLTATCDRPRNPDQLRRSRVAPPSA